MKRQIVAACGALAVASMTAGLTAQTTGTAQQRGTEAGHTVTVRGCLKTTAELMKAGSTGTASTTGAAGTTGAQSTTRQGDADFVLTDAEMTSGSSAPSGTTTPTPSTATPGTAARSAHQDHHDQFVLKAEGSSVNLKAHVNHEIEVTGRMSMGVESSAKPAAHGMTGTTAAAGTTGTTGATPRTGTTGHSGMTAHADSSKLPTLTVTSVKMVSATCS